MFGGSHFQLLDDHQPLLSILLPADVLVRLINLGDRILLDHGIPEEDIIFVTILCSTPGLHTVTQRHPKLRVVCAFVDEGLKDGIIIPGLGNFGNRYFGTEDDDTQKD